MRLTGTDLLPSLACRGLRLAGIAGKAARRHRAPRPIPSPPKRRQKPPHGRRGAGDSGRGCPGPPPSNALPKLTSSAPKQTRQPKTCRASWPPLDGVPRGGHAARAVRPRPIATPRSSTPGRTPLRGSLLRKSAATPRLGKSRAEADERLSAAEADRDQARADAAQVEESAWLAQQEAVAAQAGAVAARAETEPVRADVEKMPADVRAQAAAELAAVLGRTAGYGLSVLRRKPTLIVPNWRSSLVPERQRRRQTACRREPSATRT